MVAFNLHGGHSSRRHRKTTPDPSISQSMTRDRKNLFLWFSKADRQVINRQAVVCRALRASGNLSCALQSLSSGPLPSTCGWDMIPGKEDLRSMRVQVHELDHLGRESPSMTPSSPSYLAPFAFFKFFYEWFSFRVVFPFLV